MEVEMEVEMEKEMEMEMEMGIFCCDLLLKTSECFHAA